MPRAAGTGGEDGAMGRNLQNGEELPPKAAGELAPGDRLRLETPGGGGFGGTGADVVTQLRSQTWQMGVVFVSWLVSVGAQRPKPAIQRARNHEIPEHHLSPTSSF